MDAQKKLDYFVRYVYNGTNQTVTGCDALEQSATNDTNPFRYCGEYYDSETGNYYLRARYYDPTIGRFTQEDTHWNTANMIYGDTVQKLNVTVDAEGREYFTAIPQLLAIRQAGNLYGYAVNNPVMYIDPSGEISKEFQQKTIYDGTGGGGIVAGIWFWENAIAILSAFFTPSKDVVVAIPYSDQREEEEEFASTITWDTDATYLGIDLSGRIWKEITGPMDFETAYAWAQTRAFGRKTKWGLYTENQTSALGMAFALGGPFLILDDKRLGERPHYHVAGHDFRNIYNLYKHFHIWFGEIYQGEPQ